MLRTRRPRTTARLATDDELIACYRHGDVLAFSTLYARHKRVVFGYLLRVLGDRSRAEDVHQETWLQVVQLLERYRAGSAFKTWLFTLARSRCMDRLRRDRVRAVEIGIDAGVKGSTATETGDDPDAVAGAYALVAADGDPSLARQQEELARLLRIVLAKLPTAQREVFLLRDEAELSLVEVAAVLDVDYETVRSRYRYALARLRTELAAIGVMQPIALRGDE